MTTANLVTDTRNEEVAQLVERLRRGNVRALARAISLVENNSPLAPHILSSCFPHAGNAVRIGVTGSPGAGKSTLVNRLAQSMDGSVGILAVDPTSPFTGGAILGDRIRMQESLGLSDDGIYVRSMATRGALGGLARSTADVAIVLEASGKRTIFIETVGVGQDEVDIVRLADVTIVVLVPGMGDDVQSIKAGIMEIADIFVINKSDRDGADRLEKEVRAMQSYAAEHGGWIPPVVLTIASNGAGIDELVTAIVTFREWLFADGRGQARRRAYWRERVLEMMRGELMREVREHGFTDAELDEHASRIAAGSENPYDVVPELVRRNFRVS
jgi:LAO/AO transport system kinase